MSRLADRRQPVGNRGASEGNVARDWMFALLPLEESIARASQGLSGRNLRQAEPLAPCSERLRRHFCCFQV
jgi:hypothetical protein